MNPKYCKIKIRIFQLFQTSEILIKYIEPNKLPQVSQIFLLFEQFLIRRKLEENY